MINAENETISDSNSGDSMPAPLHMCNVERAGSCLSAWFYMLKPDEVGILYKSSYVIINAIDGSIYNPFIGILEPADNNLTTE